MKTIIAGDAARTKRIVLWGIAGAVLLVAAISAGIALRMARSNTDDGARQAATKQLQAQAGKAQDLALGGDYDAAHKQIDEALQQQGLSTDDKYALYYQQGVTYSNESKFQQAVGSFKQAEAIKTTQNLAESIATAYVQMGDNTQAIAYYKKAISLIPSSGNPVASDDKAVLEQKIRDLGGQP